MACPVCRCTETYIYCDGEDYDLGDELIRCAACSAIFEAEDEAQEDEYEDDAIAEAVAEASCSMGVGCGTAGVCYAEVNGMPDMCARVKPNYK